MRIVSLEAENVKRLRAVSIKPNGDSVVMIGGKNAQGKTSILDSIEYALGGKPNVDKPIRDGEDKARVVVETEDLIITRVFTESGTRLVVENRDGAVFKSPQKILDKLTGTLTFDPLAFTRMPPKQQVTTLRDLLGVDFSELDTERQEYYEERTLVNREIKALQANIDAFEGEEVQPVSVSELLQERERLETENRIMQEKFDAVEVEEKRVTMTENRIVDLKEELASIQEQLDTEQEFLENQLEEVKAAKEEANSCALHDLSETTEQIQNAEVINAKAVEWQKRGELIAKNNTKAIEADKLTKNIEAIDAQKDKTLAAAEFPIDGLAFDANGVTYNGNPFEQCSSAEQLRVSVAMGLTLNPELNVLLIRDGSLLDEDSLKIIAEMAVERDAQIWIEKVSEDGAGCQVVIEDGSLKT